MKRVFIDGHSGTTGLEIHRRLEGRRDLELLRLPEAERKDPQRRRALMNQADVVFLCLPDEAARQAVTLVENQDTVVIDSSTAHRTESGWAYGFPELSPSHREAIRCARRIANPGCHASGFISIVYPLVAMGILPQDAFLSCFSLTGYTGGGKSMIAAYEARGRAPALDAPGLYGLDQSHKHLREMQKLCGLTHPPAFCPVVDNFPRGMATTLCFSGEQLREIDGPEALMSKLQAYYAGEKALRVALGDEALSEGKLYANALAGRDSLLLVVGGNEQRLTVTALFDNLGKGASGAAVQNMNITLGLEEYTSLVL